jgi:hypothetical protein
VKAFLRLPPGLAFTQPNLPFLIQEIIDRLLALRRGTRRAARTGKMGAKSNLPHSHAVAGTFFIGVAVAVA